MSDPDRRNILATAILNGILDFYAAEQGGVLPVAVEPDVVQQALMVALASVVEGNPTVETKAQMRAERDILARELLLQIQAIRAHFMETGYRAWHVHDAASH